MATLNEVSKELKYPNLNLFQLSHFQYPSVPHSSPLLFNLCKRRYPAKETVRAHIAHLHAYNEIRDIGQGLIGMVADGRDVRVAEVYEEFEVDARD